MSWARTEKDPGIYDFAWLDQIIDDARSYLRFAGENPLDGEPAVVTLTSTSPSPGSGTGATSSA